MTSRLFKASGPAMTAVAAFLSLSALAIDAAAQDTEYLFFSSDVHNRSEALFDQAYERCASGDGTNLCELFGLVGDYNLQDPNTYDSDMGDIGNISMGIYMHFNWQQTPSYNLVYAQGNHDENNPYFAQGNNPSGPVPLYNNDYYDVYRINTANFESECSPLQNHLETQTNKLLIVLSHYPLHSNRDDIDQDEATCIFNAMNDAAAAGQDIMFLWGHNHPRSGRPDYDYNVRMIAVPGQTVQTGTSQYNNANAAKELHFSYVNAGYSKTDPAASTLVILQQTWMFIIRYGADADSAWVTR